MNSTFDVSAVSDIYKDAYGSRPGEMFWTMWEASNDEKRQTIWENLLADLYASINEDRINEAARLALLEDRIAACIRLGAANTVEALRWIMQAEDFDHYDLQYGAEYFCHHFGINYSAIDDLPIEDAINTFLERETS